jgi:hypothetical protein
VRGAEVQRWGVDRENRENERRRRRQEIMRKSKRQEIKARER